MHKGKKEMKKRTKNHLNQSKKAYIDWYDIQKKLNLRPINNQVGVEVIPLQFVNGGLKAVFSCNYFIDKDDRPRRLTRKNINEINFNHFPFDIFSRF